MPNSLQAEVMTQLRLASDLARYGYETYSASALIEAARILNGVPDVPN